MIAMQRPQSEQSGLTLIELIVAVALLALLTVMAYRGLDSMTRANDRTLAESERWRATTLLLERFGADVSQPARRPVRGAAGVPLPAWWGRAMSEPEGADAQFEFTRKSPPGRDESRLGYRLRDGNVELLVWRVLDRAPVSSVEVYALLEHVSALRFRHLDAQGLWQDQWPVTDSEPLPRAVSIELTLTDGPSVKRIFALP
jgi:general secretion pathway protein J